MSLEQNDYPDLQGSSPLATGMDSAMTPLMRPGGGRDLTQEIKQILLDAGLRPGEPMPTESSLIDLLGVSRGSLREALKSLQALGIIETRHGSGSFVGHLSLSAMVDNLAFHSQLLGSQDDFSTAADLTDIREILETTLIRRVAISVNEGVLEELEGMVDQMAQAVAGGKSIDDVDGLDRSFHRLLYADLGNALVLQLLDAFWKALASVRGSLPAPFEKPGDAVKKHRAIVDSLRNGNPEAAERAMKDHFASTRRWIVEGASRVQ
jgi:DNA-binding FadR family transcriptional regulator